MNGYNDLLMAVQRALNASQTLFTVATSSDDYAPSERGALLTLKGRAIKELEVVIEDFRGNDGVSVSGVSIDDDGTITVALDDGTTEQFNVLNGLKDGATIHHYKYENGELTQYTTHDIDEDGNFIDGSGAVVASFDGKDGNSVSNAEIQEDGSIKFTYTDGTEEFIGNISEFVSAPLEDVEIIDDYLYFTVDGVTVEAMAYDEDGNGIRVKLGGDDGEAGLSFYPESERESLRLLRPGDHSFGDEYFIELYDEFSADQPKIYGPLSKNVRVMESADIMTARRSDDDSLVISYPNGTPLIIPNIDGEDKADSPDQDRSMFDGEYIVSSYFDETEKKIYIDTNIEMGKWVIDVPTLQLPSGTGQVISTNNASPRIPAILNIEISDEVNSTVIPVSLGRVVGRDGYNGSYTHLSIDSENKLISSVETLGKTTETEFLDLGYHYPTNISLNQLEGNRVEIEFEDGSVLYSEVSANGADGLVPRINPDSWNIGNSENNFALSFELIDSNIETDFTNYMELRPKKGFTVAYDDTASQLTFNLGDVTDTVDVIKGLDGSSIDSLTFDGEQLVFDINGEIINSGVLPTLSSATYDVTGTVPGIMFGYSDNAEFLAEYTRPVDGLHGDYITDAVRNAEDNTLTITYGGNNFVVNEHNTDEWVIAVVKDGSEYSVEYNHTVDDIFNVDNIDGVNMSYISKVEVLDNGRYQVTMNGTDEYALFEKQDVKWITDWFVNEDNNQLNVRYNTNLEYVAEAVMPNFHLHQKIYNSFVGEGMRNDEDTLVIFTSDSPQGYTLTHNGETLHLDGDVGNILTSIDVNHDESTVTFTKSDLETTTINVDEFNGEDAVVVTDIETFRDTGDNQFDEVFNVTLSNADVRTLRFIELHGKDAFYPITTFNGIRVDNNDFTFDMSDGSELVLEVPEFQGFVPRWIDDMWVSSPSKLMVNWNDVGETEIGRVDGYDANYPVSIREENNEFFITNHLEGVEVSLGEMDGFNAVDGVWISSIAIDSNRDLIVQWSDSTEENIGLIDGIDAVFPESLSESNNTFKTINNDGSETTIGNIDGFNGTDAVIITRLRVNSNNELVAEMSDTNDITVGAINGIDASYIEQFSETDGVFTVKLSNEDEQVIGTVDGFNGIDGEWFTDIQVQQSITLGNSVHVSLNDDYGIISNVGNSELTSVYHEGRRVYVASMNNSQLRVIGPVDADTYHKFPEDMYLSGTQVFAEYNDGEVSLLNNIPDINAKDASIIIAIDKAPSFYNGDDLLSLDITDEYSINSNVSHDGSVYSPMGSIIPVKSLAIELNTHDVVLGKVDGVSALKNIDQVTLLGNDLVVTYDNGSEELIGNYNFTGVDGEWFNADWYTTDETVYNSYGDSITVRNLYIPYGNDFVEKEYNIGEIDGRPFENEIKQISIENDRIKSVSYQDEEVISDVVAIRDIQDARVENDVLFITTNHGEEFEVGYTAGEDLNDGTVVEYFEIDRDTNRLLVKYNNIVDLVDIGEINRVEYDFASIAAVDGAEQDGYLFIRLTDGSRFDLGRIKGNENTVDVIDALINIDGELIITRSEGMASLRVTDIVGVPGNGVKSGYISNGDLIFVLDDDSEINAGFVQRDLGFAPFNFTRVYNRGESSTREGRIYVALNNELTEVPTEDSSAWAIVRFEDDPSPDAGRPDVISPKEMEVYENVRPFLLGGELRNYFSVDIRGDRIFAIDLIDGNFSNPVYEATENNDGHQVEMDLTTGTEYKWRMRDVVANTGYITDWSLEGTFTVVANSITLPVVSVADGEVATAMNINAPFVSSAFNDSASSTHIASQWEIKRNSDDKIIVSERVETNLTSFMTPFAYLEEDTDYSVRVKYFTSDNESAFSDWYDFHTVAYFDFIFKPEVVFDGTDINGTVARPLFKSTTTLSRFYNDYMERDDVEVFWEVYTIDDILVWEDSNRTFITDVRVGEQLASGVTHKIRVRYDSNRLRGYSEWSDFLEFTPSWSIDTPTISNNAANPLELFFDTTFHIGDRTPANAVIDATGVNIVSGYDFTDERTTLTMTINDRAYEIEGTYATLSELAAQIELINPVDAATVVGDILTITLREVDVDTYINIDAFTVVIEVPDPDDALLTIEETYDLVGNSHVVTQEPQVTNVWNAVNDSYVSHDWEIRRKSDDRLMYGKFADFEREVDWDVQFEETDSLGEYYAQVRVNGLYGSSEWSSPYNFILQEIVFTNIYFTTSTGYVTRLDNSGSEVWTVRPSTSNMTSVVVNDNREAFVTSADFKVYKLNDLGEVVWEYIGHTNAVNDIAFYDENVIATASTDGSVHLINSITGEMIWVAEDHTSTVYDVVFDMHGDVISSSADDTVRKFDFATGELLWTFTRHTNNVNHLAVDSSGNIYTSSTDNTLRKINPRGYEEWMINASNVTDLGMDVEGTPYYTNTSGHIVKLDAENGDVVSSSTIVLTVAGTSIEVDDNLDIFVSSGTSIYMVTPEYDTQWEYTNPNGVIREIALNRQPIIVKPVGLSGRFYELKAPTNLVAF